MNIRFASVLVLALSGTCLAALPGLPSAPPGPQLQDARPEGPQNPQPAPSAAIPAPMQPMPIRGSLFKQGVAAASMGPAIGSDAGPISNVSFIAVQAPQARRYKKNDVVTIIIREASDSTTNGKADANKTMDFDLALQQFVQLVVASSGIPYATNMNNPSSLPEIKFKYTNDHKADASQQRADSISFRISGTIADVKPNGTIVLEATKVIKVDKDEQTFRLSGVCRVEDIAVDNTILSTQLANLSLSKQTKGPVHDNNKQGWLTAIIDKISPF